MKIALCGRFHTEKRHQGGSAEVFLKLSELLSKNNEVTLFGRGKPTKEIVDMCKRNKIEYHYIPSDTIFNIFLGPFRARRLLKKNWKDFDIIHSHTGSFAWASILFRKKCKVITHIHQYTFSKDSNIIVNIYTLLEKILLEKSSKKSNLTITLSKSIKDNINKHWNVKNVIVIPNGIILNEFKYTKKKKKHATFNLIYVGRLSKEKNINLLIEAIPLIKHNIILNIVGEGLEENRLNKLVKDKNLKNVIFHGRKIGDGLINLYNKSDIFILPSKQESFGIVLLEAMATGTSIVASDIPGIRSIVKNNYNGILIESTPEKIAEAIEKLIKNPKLREKLARNGLKEVKKYSWDKIVEQIEKSYRRNLI